MVSVVAFEHLDRHAEMAGGFPPIDAALHKPRCASVAQNMRRDIGAKPRGFQAVRHERRIF